MRQKIFTIFKKTMLVSTFYQAVTYAMGLLCAGLISKVLEQAIQAQWNSMGKTVAIAAVCVAAGSILLGILHRVYSRMKQDSLQNYREMIYCGTIEGEIRIHTSGELDARLQTDAETITGFYSDTCPKMIAAGMAAFVCIIILWNCDIWMALIFGVMSLLQLMPTLLYEKWAKTIYMQSMQDEESYSNWMNEGFHGISTMKSYQQEAWFMKCFREKNHAIIQSGVREAKTATVEDIVTELISAVLSYGSYMILGAFILFGRMEISQLPLLLVLLQYLFSAAAVIVEGRIVQFKYQQAVARLEEVTRQSCGEDRKAAESSVVVLAEQISKSYGDKVVLSDISIEIDKGDKILLLGANGAGKSTLMRILLGLCEPDTGSIIRDDGTKAFSFQEEPALKVSAQEIVDELVRKGIIEKKDFMRHICGFGNSEMLSRNPQECSSGQRKKFYLSIALSRNADFLILDEPTNHLDQGSVAYLQEQLLHYEGTMLVCTHDEHLSLPWNREYRIKEGKLYAA